MSLFWRNRPTTTVAGLNNGNGLVGKIDDERRRVGCIDHGLFFAFYLDVSFSRSVSEELI
jgi:hypothetical protein